MKRPWLPLPQLAFVALTACVVCGLLFAFGWAGFPPPQMDAHVYTPPAISYAAGRGLVNEVWPFLPPIDAQLRYVYHSPLYPMALGALLPVANAVWVFRVVGILNVAIVLSATFLFLQVVTSPGAAGVRGVLTWGSAVVIAASVAVTGGYLVYVALRPEPVSMLVVTWWAILRQRRLAQVPQVVVDGVALGVVVAGHPVAPLMMAPLLLLLNAVDATALKAIARTAGSGAVAALVFALFLRVYPFTLAELLHGMHLHAKFGTAVGGWAPELLVPCWLLDPYVPVLGPTVILTSGVVVMMVLARRRELGSTWLVYACLAVLSLLMFQFVFRVSYRRYNLAPFVPVALALLVKVTSSPDLIDLREWSPRARSLFLAGTAALLAVNATGFARETLLFGAYRAHGVSLEQARQAFKDSGFHDHEGTLCVTMALWALTEDYRGVAVVHDYDATAEGLQRRCSRVLFQQYSYGSVAAPEMAGFRRVEDGFLSEVPRALGVKFAHVMPGYQSAAYVREEPGQAPPR
jgi:hypothetical protein